MRPWTGGDVGVYYETEPCFYVKGNAHQARIDHRRFDHGPGYPQNADSVLTRPELDITWPIRPLLAERLHELFRLDRLIHYPLRVVELQGFVERHSEGQG